jgi:MFS family permease
VYRPSFFLSSSPVHQRGIAWGFSDGGAVAGSVAAQLCVESVQTLLILGFFLGYVSYMVNSPLNILITDVAGKQWAGSAIGTTNFIFQFASMICPVVVGFSIDFTGNFRAGWFIITAGSLVGLLAVAALKYEETAI